MRRSLNLTIYLLMGWLMAMPVHAALELELTQGIVSALPIAVLPFTGDAPVVAGNTSISKVVQNDLTNSGQFNVHLAKSSLQQGALQINRPYWRKKGINDVVVGHITRQGDQWHIHFQLVTTFTVAPSKSSDTSHNTTQAKASNDTNVLLDQTFTVKSTDLRQLAHHISDLIYQRLMGVRGIFATKIAYVLVQRNHGLDIYLLEMADADGFNPQTLLKSYQPIMSPAWSPDGSKLAYVSFESGKAAVYVQNILDGMRTVVSNSPGINGAPAFSPDGKQLALVLTLTGNPKIYLLNLNNLSPVQLTKGFALDTEPAWAPDGKSLIFTSRRGGNPQIYQYQLASGLVNRMTYDGSYNARASFLPNDQGIVMMHRSGGMFGIARLSFKSGRTQVLTQTGADESPSLAPNGKMILYATRYAGREVLGIVSTDGRIKLRLPSPEGEVQSPAWSPFLS